LLLQRNRPEDVGLPAIEKYHGEPETVILPEASPMAEKEGSWQIVREVLRNRIVWLLAVVYFLVKPTRYLLLYWSPVFVNERLGTGTATSGFLGSMFDLAGPVGTLVGGFVSDRVFKSRRIPICVLSLLCLAIFIGAFRYVPGTRLETGAGMFVIGFLIYIPDSLIAGAAAIDFGTK